MTELYRDKIDWIVPKTKGKKVLDLGCVRHNIEETRKSEWLHGLIVGVASDVLGVDYLVDEVKALQNSGYKVACANVETMDLPGKYEVVVAGDLIEHLNNFGLFLERVKHHLADDGIFVLTTPNPVNLMRFVRVLASGKPGANPEHTCWFTEKVLLQLADRYDLTAREIVYIDDSAQYYRRLKWRPILWVGSLLCRLRPQYAETIGVVFEKRK